MDEFELLAPDVGEIRHIRIGHDSDDGWFLRKVLAVLLWRPSASRQPRGWRGEGGGQGTRHLGMRQGGETGTVSWAKKERE